MKRIARPVVALLAFVAIAAVVWSAATRPADDERREPPQVVSGGAPDGVSTAPGSRGANRVRAEPPTESAPTAPHGTVSFRVRAPEGVHPPTVRVTGMAPLSGPLQLIDEERAWSDDPVTIDVPAGRALIAVKARGCASAQREVVVTAGADTSLGEILLGPGCSIEGRIVDAEGRPVQRAEVRFERERERPWGRGEEGMQLSSESGAFGFDGIRAGRFELCVKAAGYLADNRTLEVSAAAPPVTVTLYRGGSVRGVVRDGSGAPVSGVRVAIAAEGSDHSALLLTMDESASFSERLAPGRWHVAVRDDEGEEIAARDVDVTEGSALDVDLRVER